MLWQLAALICFLIAAMPLAEAREVTAASCSVADIQAAVDGMKAEGGVVRIPAGEAEAVEILKLPGGVSLLGAGVGQTKLFRGPGTDMMKSGNIISVDGSNGKPIRISGLNLVGFIDPASAGWDGGISISNAIDFRIDNCRLQRFGASGIGVRGLSRGVIDHCLFVDNFKKTINNVGYGVVVMGTGQWRDDLVPGSADSVFMEDCEFIGSRHAVASNGGARYVFRHNHVHGNDNSQAVDAHGPGYGSAHGTQWIEVYDNLIEKPIGGHTAMCLRGGGGVVFGNTIRDYVAAIMLTLDFDVKLDWTRPYPIAEQIGNMWVWDNTHNDRPALVMIPPRSAEHVKPDRDYFLKPMPGYEPYQYPHPLTTDRGN
ncbi:MAG: right-handed parallel beta-helix repeat-containing protein [Armatimonadota bacterium]